MGDRFGYGEIGLDINPCHGCEDYDALDGCKSNGGCGKPITNYDRIISKTPEELAEWLRNIRYSWTCLPRDNGNRCADFKDDCNACWLDWLRQETKEDE